MAPEYLRLLPSTPNTSKINNPTLCKSIYICYKEYLARTTFLADRHFYCKMCLSGAIPDNDGVRVDV
jgi:hypothetical protein